MNEENKLSKIYEKFDYEYLIIVNEILNNDEFKKRIEYNHHETRSVFTHSLIVSLKSYKIAKILRLDYRSAAIGGLLHDFYYEDWHKTNKKGFKNQHGFVHSREALENSIKTFPGYIDEKIGDIILKHMFPLNIRPPRYIEGWIITIVDKVVSMEVLSSPKKLYKYVGLALIINIIKRR